jgi:hypothetical protein
MSDQRRQLTGALEHIGGLLEQHIAQEPRWRLGAVEREVGAVEAHVSVGLARSPAHIRFLLSRIEHGTTQIQVELVAKSRWCTRGLCFSRSGALLDAIAAQL